MEKASWVEDIAWSRRCRWVIDTVRGLENMLVIDRNIESIVHRGPKCGKGRPERRGSYLVGTGQAVFVSVSHCDELAFLGLLQRGRRCEFRVWSRTKIKLGSPYLNARAQKASSDMTNLYHATTALRFPCGTPARSRGQSFPRTHTHTQHAKRYEHPLLITRIEHNIN